MAIVHARQGPDHLPALRNLSGDGFRDPYPISRDLFLVAQGRKMVQMDRAGAVEVIHQLETSPGGRELHEPRPIVTRPREPVLSARSSPTGGTARLVLADAYQGRNLAGVDRGEIAKLQAVTAYVIRLATRVSAHLSSRTRAMMVIRRSLR